jgi:hypothetical protein
VPPVPRRLSILLVLLLASQASADVVILVGNGTPLTGKIVQETETTVRFRIAGLADGSFVEIERSRIRMLWRDGERDGTPREEPSSSAAPPSVPRPAAPPGRRTGPGAQDPLPGPRSPEELRDGYLQRLRDRLRRLVPDSAPTASLTIFLALLVGTLLLWIGGRLADTEDLGLPQCAVLSLLTMLLVIVDLYTAPTLARSPALVVAISAELVFWLLFVRILLHEALEKAVVLLAFLLLATGLIGLVGVSVLSVL